MQEPGDLKNLVIQGLESEGLLTQIRAQIRASVFKIIDREEGAPKNKSNFYWENPFCQAIHNHAEGVIALDLIYDLLEFFHMDYTLSVFKNEANVRNAPNRNELAKKVGLPRSDENRPVLMNLVSASAKGELKHNILENIAQSDAKSTASLLAKNSNISASTASSYQPKNLKSAGFEKDNSAANTQSLVTKQPIKEQKSDSSPTTVGIQKATGGKPNPLSAANTSANKSLGSQPRKESPPKNSFNSNSYSKKDEDDYAEEVFEDIAEESNEDPLKNSKDKKGFGTSSDSLLIAASQSQGFDVSVDSLALEEYDYVEDAEKA